MNGFVKEKENPLYIVTKDKNVTNGEIIQLNHDNQSFFDLEKDALIQNIFFNFNRHNIIMFSNYHHVALYYIIVVIALGKGIIVKDSIIFELKKEKHVRLNTIDPIAKYNTN